MYVDRNQSYQKGRAWIELDQAALRHNVEVLCALLPVGCHLMPVLKADAYGHGAVLVAQELYAMGIEAFCVACVQEGVALRKHGVKGEILILGYTHPAQLDRRLHGSNHWTNLHGSNLSRRFRHSLYPVWRHRRDHWKI